MNPHDVTKTHREPDMFDLRLSARRIYETTLQHKLLVLIVCVLTLALTTAYFFVWPPIYKAKATLMAEQESDEARDTFYTNWNVFRKDDPRTEVELMTSGAILKKVIEIENLTYDDVYHPPLTHLAYLWQTSPVGKWYQSLKRRIFPPGEDQPTPEEIELGRTLNDMAAGISILPIGESNVGKLTVKGPSRRVARVANTLMDVYLASRIKRHNTEAKKALDVLTEQADKAGKELGEVEDRRTAYAQEHGLAFDLQKETLEVAQLTEAEASIAGNRMKTAALQATLREVEKQLQAEPKTRITSTVYELNAVRENIKLKRMELETSLIQLRDRYRDDSPEVREIEGNIAELEAMAAQASERVEKASTEALNSLRLQLISKRSELMAELEGTKAGFAVLEEREAKLRARLAKVPIMRGELRDLDRDAAVALQKYQELLLKQAQAEVSLATAALVMPSMRVVDYAVTPVNRYWPKTKYLFPGALLVGLFLGVVAGQIKSYIDGRIHKTHLDGGRGAAPLYGTVAIATRRRPFSVPRSAVTASSGDSSDRKRK